MATAAKDPGALKTIGELSHELGIAQHILRYWETRFPQLKPMQRAGNRRYYRPADVALARRIHRLLNDEGYTVRGVQKLLRDKSEAGAGETFVAPPAPPPPAALAASPASGIDVFRLIGLRDRLADALDD
ncbi:MAG: MerR family transcriptional regulator [Sphingomicrobium sp.]